MKYPVTPVPLPSAYPDLSDRGSRLLMIVLMLATQQKTPHGVTATRAELAKICGWQSVRTVSRAAADLIDHHIVTVVKDSNGMTFEFQDPRIAQEIQGCIAENERHAADRAAVHAEFVL